MQIYWNVKESVYIKKEFKSHRTGLVHQHGRRFIVLGVKYGRHEVMWKHSLYPSSFPNLSIKSRIRRINFWTAFFYTRWKKGVYQYYFFQVFKLLSHYTWHLAQYSFSLCWRDMQGSDKWLPMSVSRGIYWEKLRCKHWRMPLIPLQTRYHDSLLTQV